MLYIFLSGTLTFIYITTSFKKELNKSTMLKYRWESNILNGNSTPVGLTICDVSRAGVAEWLRDRAAKQEIPGLNLTPAMISAPLSAIWILS